MAVYVDIEFLETNGQNIFHGHRGKRCDDYAVAEMFWLTWQRENVRLLVTEMTMNEVN